MSMKITPPNGMSTPAGGGSPGGSAGGDLGGTFPGPKVTGLQGTPVCITAPTVGDALIFDGTEWCPAAAGGLDSVTDGTTTVTPVNSIDFTEGATVTDLGGGVAGVAIFAGMVPYLIESGETFTVPVKKQALFNESITVDAGGSLVVMGHLLMVT